MDDFFEKEHPLIESADNLKADKANFIAKDQKHGGSSCDSFYEYIDALNGKFLFFLN